MLLNQLTIPSQDLHQAIPFYETLGFQLIVDSRPRYVRFLAPDGQATFSIHRVDQPIQQPGVHIYFECEELDKQVARLEAKGIVFLTQPTDQSWLWREAHLEDPDGNHLTLYQAGGNRINPPWRV
ncbi:MAG: VOC family protein [Bacteroidota bacterium]